MRGRVASGFATSDLRPGAKGNSYKKSGEEWVPVKAAGEYGVAKDAWNAVAFAPVRTTALRLEVELQTDWSAGVHEWKVK